jgi:predicted nuclease with TOPRIM domain
MPMHKSLHDLRTMRSVKTRPIGEVQAFIEMNRLTAEAKRLEHELEMWTQKVERIQKRLHEIEQKRQAQMLELGYESRNDSADGAMPRGNEKRTASSETLRELRQVTLEY